MKTISPQDLNNLQLQTLLQTAIAPRPIALASTIDKDGNVIMTHDQYDWWTTEIEKLVKIDDLLVEISFDGKDYYQYANETNGCDLETQTNMQLAWLKEYQSNH